MLEHLNGVYTHIASIMHRKRGPHRSPEGRVMYTLQSWFYRTVCKQVANIDIHCRDCDPIYKALE